MFLKIYLIGVVLGILTSIYIYLKIKELCQKKNIPYDKKIFFVSAASTFKAIMFILTPMFGYIVFFGMLFSEDDKIEEVFDNVINKYQ